MVVPFPATSGVTGTITVSDRLGETATFTDDDLTLLQTLTGHLAVASTGARMVESWPTTRATTRSPVWRTEPRWSVASPTRRAADGGTVAVMLLDLDRFKEVNDALGHARATRSCRSSAERLRSGRAGRRPPSPGWAVTSSPCYLCDLTGIDDARRSPRSVAAELARRCSIDGAVLNAEASIGIAVLAGGARNARRPS